MRTGTLRRHRAIGVGVLLSLGGLVIAACAPAPEEAAPVYLMGTVAPDTFGKVSPVMRQSLAAAQVEPAVVSDPTPLAPSLTGSASAGQTAVDAIPLDDPPAQAKQLSNPAWLAANPAPMSARFMPAPNLSAPMPESAPAPVAAAKVSNPIPDAASASSVPFEASRPVAAPAPQPAAAPVMLPRPEPSAAELARAEPAPAPSAVPQTVPAMAQRAVAAAPASTPLPVAEPMRGDIATSGLVVSARDERAARSRPRYFYAP